MKLERSLKRKQASSAISSGRPRRPSGVSALMRAICSSLQHVGHFGLDQAGRDAVDAHAVRSEGVRAAAGQRNHARLGRRVMDLQGPRPQRSHRGE